MRRRSPRALVKQAFPAWTVGQVRNALMGSAQDILGAGWDRNSGTGIVMPLAALQVNGAPAVAALKLLDVVPAEVNGNGNGLPDSGEDWQFDITLGNSGGAAATGVVATLTSNTPGVVVTSGAVAYADVPVNGSAANPAATPFRFSLFDIACGQSIQLTLRVTADQNPLALDFPIHQPSNLALGAPLAFSYANRGVAIPDGVPGGPGPTLGIGLAVSGVPAAVGAVSLRIDGLNSCMPNDPSTAGIEHTYVGDLVLGLKAPDGTRVNVIDRMAGGNNDGRNFCNTTLDDRAAGGPIGTISRDLAPFAGSFKPDSPLSAFQGGDPNGTWELQATDFVESETGKVNAFTVTVWPQACARVDRPVAMAAAKTVTGTFAPGDPVTYTVTLTNTGLGLQADNPGDEYVDVLPPQLTLAPPVGDRDVGGDHVIRQHRALERSARRRRRGRAHDQRQPQPGHRRHAGQQPGHGLVRPRPCGHEQRHAGHRRSRLAGRRGSDGLRRRRRCNGDERVPRCRLQRQLRRADRRPVGHPLPVRPDVHGTDQRRDRDRRAAGERLADHPLPERHSRAARCRRQRPGRRAHRRHPDHALPVRAPRCAAGGQCARARRHAHGRGNRGLRAEPDALSAGRTPAGRT
ncbi:MAG: proprotein convertase P-domain-containing protein [Betaproteobacteria bacterium]|nr:proprotein convertase P-domain-containing protein [Betaproteobacteria bacterium]